MNLRDTVSVSFRLFLAKESKNIKSEEPINPLTHCIGPYGPSNISRLKTEIYEVDIIENISYSMEITQEALLNVMTMP